MKVVLTVAGTDPSGAAGIQADLHVIRDHGCHGTSVVTAVLAQNTCGVRQLVAVEPAMVEAQIRAVLDDFDVAAVKVGLVPNGALCASIAALVGHLPVVWDPVLQSGDGKMSLFEGDATAIAAVLAATTVFTPNAIEAATVAGVPAATRAQAHIAAARLAEAGAAILLKAGHLKDPGGPLGFSDVWADASGTLDLEPLPAVADDVRGTGCHLSTAIACALALGARPLDAAESARRYLNERLHEAVALGRGRRLLSHA